MEKKVHRFSGTFRSFMIDENGHWAGVVSPKESPFSEKDYYLDREGIRETFFQLFFEVGSENPFAQILFYFFNCPEPSAIQFVTGMNFSVINGFVDKKQALFSRLDSKI